MTISTTLPASRLAAATTLLGTTFLAPPASAGTDVPSSLILVILIVPAALAIAALVLSIIMLARGPAPTGQKAPQGVPIAALIVGVLGLVAAALLRNVLWMAIASALPSAAAVALGAVRLSGSKPTTSN